MRKIFVYCIFITASLSIFGCNYTQKDYNLQEKYQQRQREIDEARKKDGYTVRW